MNQLNSLIIEGNVTRAPDLREPTAGFKVCTIPLAVNRFYKNKAGEGVNEVSYFNVETYGKMAEICMTKCEKGRGMRVVGRLKQDRWVTPEGKKTSRVSIIAEHVEFKKLLLKPESNDDLGAIAEANQVALEEELQMERESALASDEKEERETSDPEATLEEETVF